MTFRVEDPSLLNLLPFSLWAFAQVDGTPAAPRAALALILVLIRSEAVVIGQFFPGADSPFADEQDAPPGFPGDQVRLAAMVDIFRTRAADRPVDDGAA